MLGPRLFPIILICLNLCASAAYFGAGDWKRGIYWIAAATLTATITF